MGKMMCSVHQKSSGYATSYNVVFLQYLLCGKELREVMWGVSKENIWFLNEGKYILIIGLALQKVIHYVSPSFYNDPFSLQKMLLAWNGQDSVKPTVKGLELGRSVGWHVPYLLCLSLLFGYCAIYVLLNLKPQFFWSAWIYSDLLLGLKITHQSWI